MTGRPMLAWRLLSCTAEQWFGRPVREICDADWARWIACRAAAQKVLRGEE